MSAKSRGRLRAVASWGSLNYLFKGYMMQKVQMGGGAISPTVTAHVQKNTMQPKYANSDSKQPSATQIGGGIISPEVKKHVVKSAGVTMGGGFISPKPDEPEPNK